MKDGPGNAAAPATRGDQGGKLKELHAEATTKTGAKQAREELASAREGVPA